MPPSQNYVRKFEDPHEIEDDPLAGENDSKKTEQGKDCLYIGIKKVLEFDGVNARFDHKLHFVSDTLISYGFFLKAYVIQKKFRY